MKKCFMLIISLVLTAVIFTGCGCTNQSSRETTAPNKLPTTETTRATTAPTTMPTTAPTTASTTAPHGNGPLEDTTLPTGTGSAEDASTSPAGANSRMPRTK